MQKDTVLKILFVINPVSGGKEKRDWEEKIRTFFKQSPHNMEFYILTGESDEASVQYHIKSINPDRVVGVGGDGTIKMLAEMLYHTPLPLGIIPAGSANGMAKELGIPVDIDTALDIVLNGDVTPIDVIKIDDKEICIHLSDLGMNAMLVKQFESSEGRGMWGYGKAVFRMLLKKQKMYVTIQTDTETVKRKAYMVAIANATKYGTGATINPEGNVSDGLFEVVVVRKLNVVEMAKAILTDKSFDPSKIEIFKTKTAVLSTLHRAYFQVDGEYRGRVKKVKATVQSGCLHVVLPQKTATEETK
ncbi:MAG TPA: diacylglycerol kinase family protein [Chitinophagaceae bacterium]|nr:diacylglycerol kinase family protein [Chitinophagaceae bacterium]